MTRPLLSASVDEIMERLVRETGRPDIDCPLVRSQIQDSVLNTARTFDVVTVMLPCETEYVDVNMRPVSR